VQGSADRAVDLLRIESRGLLAGGVRDKEPVPRITWVHGRTLDALEAIKGPSQDELVALTN
jgi:hypothetical protein